MTFKRPESAPVIKETLLWGFCCWGLCSCQLQPKITSVVNSDPKTGNTSQVTIIEKQDLLSEIIETAEGYGTQAYKWIVSP